MSLVLASALDASHIRALLLDVEGTTTPVEFVYDELFPYARARLAQFLSQQGNDPEVRSAIHDLRAEYDADRGKGLHPPAWLSGAAEKDAASAASYGLWLMDRDRKSTPLKSLQGRIWEDGYRAGALRGRVFHDVPRAFARWHAQGRRIAIFSSGSVLAQKLLFRHSESGDLTGYLCGYFDTTVGSKRDARSYEQIARQLGAEPHSILFASDVSEELDAARQAGMQPLLVVRGTQLQETPSYPVVRDFDGLLP